MTRYAKLQRRIRQEQESFLEDLVLQAGFKLCTDLNKVPEGRGVFIVPEEDSERGTNFILIPTFAVPNYMSVNKNSPTFIERSAQEKDVIRQTLEDLLPSEGLKSFTQGQFTNDVKLYLKV